MTQTILTGGACLVFINILNIRDKINISDFFDTLTSNSFFPQITFPTRFSERCGTLIDNFFVKSLRYFNTSALRPSTILLVILVKQVPPKMIESRRLNTENINDFVDALSVSNMYDQLDTDRKCNPNENYNILHSIISYSINENFPSRLIMLKHKHKHS